MHPEIQHVAGKGSPNQRFFLTTGFANMTDWLQKLQSKNSPCVCMESGAPLSSNNGWEYKDYTIYFCVRAPMQMQAMDGPEAKECKRKATQLAKEFRNCAVKMNKKWRMRGESVHVEKDFNIEEFGPFWNWWYAAELVIRVGEALNECEGEELVELL